MTGEDALFDGPGPACILLKEFFIVICFDEKRAELEKHEFMMGVERAGWRWRVTGRSWRGRGHWPISPTGMPPAT